MNEIMTRPAAHRPAQFPEGAEGFRLFREQTEDFLTDTTAAKPSITMWASALGITRMTLSNYRRRGSEWSDFIAMTVKRIRSIRSGGEAASGSRSEVHRTGR